MRLSNHGSNNLSPATSIVVISKNSSWLLSGLKPLVMYGAAGLDGGRELVDGDSGHGPTSSFVLDCLIAVWIRNDSTCLVRRQQTRRFRTQSLTTYFWAEENMYAHPTRPSANFQLFPDNYQQPIRQIISPPLTTYTRLMYETMVYDPENRVPFAECSNTLSAPS